MFRAYIALIALGLIWGTNFIYMKMATNLISPTQTVFIRVFFGFLPLAIWAWKAKVITRAQLKHLPHFIVMSLLATTLYYYGFVAGTAQLPTSIAGMLSGSIPLFTFLTTLVFLNEERPTRQVGLGIALGFLGIALSARPWDSSSSIPLEGVLWMIGGTLSIGISFVYARKFLSPLNLSPLALATWQCGLAVLTLLLFTDFSGISNLSSSLHATLGAIIGLGMIGTGGAFLIYYFIIAKLGPVKASGATYIAPVVAVIIGAFIGEEITIFELIALCMILGGVVLIQTGKAKPALISSGNLEVIAKSKA